MTNVLAAIALLLFAFLFVRGIASIGAEERLQFRIRDLFVLTTGVALLSAAGCVVDALMLCFMIVYTLSVGRAWKRRGGSTAQIFGSLAGVMTIISVIVAEVAPVVAWRPGVFYMGLFTSAYISFMFIVGDNATSELQLLLAGLPFGLPINMAVGALIGAVLEWAVNKWRSAPSPPNG